MNLDTITATLRVVAASFSGQSPRASWWIFGSSLHGVDRANDVDVLIIYSPDDQVTPIREEVGKLKILPPIHLLFMSADEEGELNFCAEQGCHRIYPQGCEMS